MPQGAQAAAAAADDEDDDEDEDFAPEDESSDEDSEGVAAPGAGGDDDDDAVVPEDEDPQEPEIPTSHPIGTQQCTMSWYSLVILLPQLTFALSLCCLLSQLSNELVFRNTTCCVIATVHTTPCDITTLHLRYAISLFVISQQRIVISL